MKPKKAGSKTGQAEEILHLLPQNAVEEI